MHKKVFKNEGQEATVQNERIVCCEKKLSNTGVFCKLMFQCILSQMENQDILKSTNDKLSWPLQYWQR